MHEGDSNTDESWCRRCRAVLAAGEGVWHKRAMVHRDACPQPAEILRPNRYAGACEVCGGWVVAGDGIAVRQDKADMDGERYQARHDGYCPTVVVAPPLDSGFTGQWSAGSIGIKVPADPSRSIAGWNPDPWVRELTFGEFGQQKYRWIRGRRDYSKASPDGSFGIVTGFTIRYGRTYEAECVVETPSSGRINLARRRMYLSLTPDGDVTMLKSSAKEVREWLAAG